MGFDHFVGVMNWVGGLVAVEFPVGADFCNPGAFETQLFCLEKSFEIAAGEFIDAQPELFGLGQREGRNLNSFGIGTQDLFDLMIGIEHFLK